MDYNTIEQALTELGRRLEQAGHEGPLLLRVGGALAVMKQIGRLAGRDTIDCDVLLVEPGETWDLIRPIADDVGRDMELPQNWLNNKTAVFLWIFPLGWRDRCEYFGTFGTFGPIRVEVVGRQDIIAVKVVAAVERGRDMADLQALRPASHELEFVRQYLDRIEREHLDRKSFAVHRALLYDLDARE